MKTTLLLNNLRVQARLLLENPAPAKMKLLEPEAVAGCNCDRWGHPCLGCNQRKVQQHRATDFIVNQEMT